MKFRRNFDEISAKFSKIFIHVCRPLFMFWSTKIEYKHPAEHHDVEKRVTGGLYEPIRTSSVLGGILQHEYYLTVL